MALGVFCVAGFIKTVISGDCNRVALVLLISAILPRRVAVVFFAWPGDGRQVMGVMEFLRVFGVAVLLLLLLMGGGRLFAAEIVEVAPGVAVPKRSFDAPIIEQPFFGFATKTPAQLKADEKFLEYFAAEGTPLDEAFIKTMTLGWQALGRGQVDIAARRFNQAHLIKPGHPDVFHGLAVVVHLRFKDHGYAEILFAKGAGLAGRSAGYMADYGRFLVTQGKAGKALPVLEEAVREQPGNATAWSNLGWARLQSGQLAAACAAALKSAALEPPARVVADIKLLRQRANCGE